MSENNSGGKPVPVLAGADEWLVDVRMRAYLKRTCLKSLGFTVERDPRGWAFLKIPVADGDLPGSLVPAPVEGNG